MENQDLEAIGEGQRTREVLLQTLQGAGGGWPLLVARAPMDFEVMEHA